MVGPTVNSWQQGEALAKMKEDLAKTFLWAEREVRTFTAVFFHSANPNQFWGQAGHFLEVGFEDCL